MHHHDNDDNDLQAFGEWVAKQLDGPCSGWAARFGWWALGWLVVAGTAVIIARHWWPAGL